MQNEYGVPPGNSYLKKILSDEKRNNHVKNQIIFYLNENLYLMKFVNNVSSFLKNKLNTNAKPESNTCPKSRWDSLSDGVLKNYFKNINFLINISKTYSIKTIFYWEPRLTNKLQKTNYERESLKNDNIRRPGLHSFLSLVGSKSKESEYDFFGENIISDLSMTFTNISDPIYIDAVHYEETGNGIIADEIVSDILSIYSD